MSSRLAPWLALTLLVLVVTKTKSSKNAWKPEEETREFWDKVAEDELETALKNQKLNTKKAKNVIVFIGDGMDISTVTAARILKGQLDGNSGEETKLTMDRLPHAALSRTYSVDRQVSDSGATATAIVSGVKTKDFTVGLTGGAKFDDCLTSAGNEVNSSFIEAWEQGKSIGFVTTTRINHATPSSVYAHTPNRLWYGDADMSAEAKADGCRDIAQQFIDNSHMITVALGGGRVYFRPNTSLDEEYIDISGRRLDGQDLIEKWKTSGEDGERRRYVWRKKELEDLNLNEVDKLLGIFEPKDMKYEAEREQETQDHEPSIEKMVEVAIKMLQKNENGFYLMVEGGRIDHAHHDGNAYRALHDTLAFDKSIQKALDLTSDDNTLIIVTADHGHTLAIGGYSHRGESIFGFASNRGYNAPAWDGKRFTTMAYANGPGYQGMDTANVFSNANNSVVKMAREDPETVDTAGIDYLQQTAVPMTWETHGGGDVSILASGPMSHLFHGVHQQNYIAHVIRYASRVGKYADECHVHADDAIFLGRSLNKQQTEMALYIQFTLLVVLAVLVMILLLHVICKRNKRSETKPERV